MSIYSIALRPYPPPCHYFANDGSWVSLAVIARIVGTMDMWRLPHGSIVKERLERSPVRLMPSATEKRTITTHHSEPRHASRAQGTVADWLIGCLVGRLLGWLVYWLVDWLVDWSVGWLIGWLIGWLDDWLIGRLVD